MPRVPSMTAAEAEAAIGRRGEVTVTADNRGLVRKWFVAQGLPTLFVGLSMRELALAYNDTKGEQFSRLMRKWACHPWPARPFARVRFPEMLFVCRTEAALLYQQSLREDFEN
jgi:hypothetical protein